MDFEFDPEKSTANVAKHGIDFMQAQKLWEDKNITVVPARIIGAEVRDVYIGLIERKHWVAVVTYRAEAVRIISVRRARKEEKAFYESK